MTPPAFSVRIRPLGSTCRVHVDGAADAQWLFDELRQSLGHQTCEKLQLHAAGHHLFTVKYDDTVTRGSLLKKLRSIPQVTLSDQPA